VQENCTSFIFFWFFKTEVYFLNSPARVEKYAKEKLFMQKVKPKIIKIEK